MVMTNFDSYEDSYRRIDDKLIKTLTMINLMMIITNLMEIYMLEKNYNMEIIASLIQIQ